MNIFSRIRRVAWSIGMLLVALLIVPSVQGQDTPDQILYAVINDSGGYRIYTVNVDDGVKTQIGTVTNDAGWSPHGHFIYLLNFVTPNESALTLVNMDTNQRQTISDQLEAYGCSSWLWWSPDGEWLAYNAHLGSKSVRKILNTTTGNTQVLTDAHLGSEMSWSADSRYVAYTIALPETFEQTSYPLGIWDVQQQKEVMVLEVGTSELPQWSPTEDLLVFIDAHLAYIVVYDATKGTKRQYENNQIGEWSPDGRFLILYRTSKNSRSLSVIDVLADEPDEFGMAGVGPAAWSSDSRYLATSTFDDTGKETIYVLDTMKRSIQQVKIDPVFHNMFMWSPSGNVFAFAADPADFDQYVAYSSLWLFDADNQQTFQFKINIPSRPFEQALDWSSTGLYMTVWADTSVALMDLASRQLKLLSDATHTFAQPHWSPDGTRLALALGGSDEHDMYMFTPDSSALENITRTPKEDEIFLGWRGGSQHDILNDCGATSET